MAGRLMDERDKEIARLKHRIAGLEKTLQIVTGHSGRIEKNLSQLFEVISDTMPVPLLITSKAGDILFSNGKARETFGYPDKTFQKLNAVYLYENLEDRSNLVKTIDDQKEVRGFEINLKKADGQIFPVSVFSRQISFEGNDCLLSVIYDLSDLREEEQKRLMLERQLRQTQKMEAIGTMASGIAHDFNSVLTVIFGRLQLAMTILPEESHARKQIKNALSAAEKARALIVNLMTFCHKKDEERKPLCIDVVVAEAMEMIKPIKSSKIEIRQRIDTKGSIIMGDPVQIQQVLLNLCSNANHVLRDRGGYMEICLENVRIDSSKTVPFPNLEPDFYVRLTVRDNGPGIDRDIIDRIFDPFFTTKTIDEGTGMGLAIVHGIIQRHGGAVSVESEPGKGTAFHCYFPLIAQKENLIEKIEDRQKDIDGNNE